MGLRCTQILQWIGHELAVQYKTINNHGEMSLISTSKFVRNCMRKPKLWEWGSVSFDSHSHPNPPLDGCAKLVESY